MTTTSSIIKAIGDKNVQLHKGDGYWYFIYDTIDIGGIYKTESVYTMFLRDLSKTEWVDIGISFLKDCKSI